MSERTGWLDRLERAGNALPDPTSLFVLGALLVLVGAEIAVRSDWVVAKTITRPVTETVVDAAGAPLVDPASGEPLTRARPARRG